MSIIEKIVTALKEIYATSAGDKTDTIIETLDKGIKEIGSAVVLIILSAEQHFQEKLANGEAESVLRSHKDSSIQFISMSKHSLNLLRKQREAKEAAERLLQMEYEQKQKEQEIDEMAVELQLTKQRTEEARRIEMLNKSKLRKLKEVQLRQ